MKTYEDWIREENLDRLRQQLKVGTAQLDNGEGIVIDSKPALDALFEEIKD